jgi:hypothetical protein
VDANAVIFNNPQQTMERFGCKDAQHPPDCSLDMSVALAREAKHDDAGEIFGRVRLNIRKVEIQCDERSAFGSADAYNSIVRLTT